MSDAWPTIEDLRDTLHEFQRTHGFGRGIAAIQIGVKQRVIYIEMEGRAYELVNPVIEWASEEKFQLWDDCFSFPDLMVELERSQRVRICYEDREGRARELEAEWGLAELLQHEIDHLDGVLAIDRALDPKYSFATRAEHKRKYP